MEWGRAKNLLLVFFILLNLVLAGLIFMENLRYTVTGDQEALIRSVLAQHNISMYTEMIHRFPPMRALQVSGYYYNEEELLAIFFHDPAMVERVEFPGGVDFIYGNAIMFIDSGFVTYFNPDGLGISVEAFIETHFPDFIRDYHFTPHDEEGLRVIYRQAYRGYMVYSNYIEFLVTERGIIEVDMQFGRIIGFDGSAHNLFAPDEALITFLQRVQATMGNQPVTIRHMDIVYFLEFDAASDEYGSTHHAIPFYRIFIEESEMPFLINAYMNVSIDV
ncbi:MAG: hypothetical protein FWB88_01350 [Defluviitaleaceae bacterium]|nr:hypothetical protein [Defluviitaleaceae bacterium]MCL2240608.1 hypothetical protein [Defluviitaleaceae bacterium]